MRRSSARFVILVVLLAVLALGVLVPVAQAVEVLVILPHHYGVNYFLARDIMDELGWQVTLTGTANPVQPCTWGDGVASDPMPVDLLVTEITDITQYDAVLVLSSSAWTTDPYQDLVDSPETLFLLMQANDAGKVIGGWCGATRVFAAAGIIDGKNVTGHNDFAAEYTAAGANFLGPNLPPVTDGNLVTTTRGMYFRLQNVEAVADAIEAQLDVEQAKGGVK